MSDIEALLNERAGYLVRGLKDRVAQVDRILAGMDLAVADEPTSDPCPPVDEVADSGDLEVVTASGVAVETADGKPAKRPRRTASN